MDKYTMTCTCGDVMSVEAESREEAVEKMKGIMNEQAVAKHMAERHAGEPAPSVAEAHAMIAERMQKAE